MSLLHMNQVPPITQDRKSCWKKAEAAGSRVNLELREVMFAVLPLRAPRGCKIILKHRSALDSQAETGKPCRASLL